MIFHTSADEKFYDSFFHLFANSISRNCTNKKISLNYVGLNTVQTNLVDIFSQDTRSINDIAKEFKTTDRNTLGYYAMSRWASIPLVNEHVAICDIDILAINKIDLQVLNQNLDEYPVINITRIKPNGNEGGMMIMILRKDICKEVKDYAQNILYQYPLTWSRDVDVRSMLYEKYPVKNMLNMYQLTKRTTDEDLKSVKEWFAFSKGNPNQKLERMLNVEKILQNLVD